MADDKDGVGILDVRGAFANPDESVINWQGNNYYKACDEPVTENADGGGTFCVKREGHPGDIHEDYDGVRKTTDKGRYVIVVSVPFNPTKAGFDEVQRVMQTLKDHLGEKDGRLVYNAIRDVADQIIMILDGDG